jgi:hypothetical protein
VVKLLLQTCTNYSRKSLLHIDTKPEVSNGCNLQDGYGLTPLLCAMYCGHDDVVLLLANHGADLSILDLYGRNAWDWILANPLLSRSFECSNFPGQPTPPRQQITSLQRTILAIAQRLVVSESPLERPGFSALGHCFVFLRRISDSIFSFQQNYTGWNEANDPLNTNACDGCPSQPNIIGVRYVCKVCPDTDLCTECMHKYLLDDGLKHCKNHPFLEVPVPARELATQPTDRISDNVQTWLRQLILEFKSGEEHS